ncbi:FAD-dependent monooxygenase [Tsukamurella sp. 8F]|uniref:FAD-dependent monooxygenase n=1 Tax=unclassified Tsukamurella TaxID=2633480 RepID=UPI0023BA05B7|nr:MULTISPECIES: FAD-dependent monooxygenase [unclassified Tsukamurella]MDF0530198.1 FAD-dependent monooxygenase [Tsukamurella sp. 8J]MDF0586515.1 FAD-dependent monooxygenase [Tsukamurella sp. 8F]
MKADVVVVGGGPTGMWLACELSLAGVSTVVLEQRRDVDPHSRALTVHPRTVETLALRDAHGPLLAESGRLPSGHFAALDERLDFSCLDTDFPFTLTIPQARTTRLLEQRARGHGAAIRRGHRVIGLADDGDAVRVSAEGPDGRYCMAAEYVVGCDGTRSTVREHAGIPFVGTDFSTIGWLGDVTLADPPSAPVVSVWSRNGAVMCVALPDGQYRFVGNAPEDNRTDWPGEPTFDELRSLVVRVLGTDFGMHTPTWLSRFGDTSRLASTYRKGRVLLAGDAAHQHMPNGGVGLNVGVQDAMNLGWKLAATVSGRAPDGLLDTYHAERHPVGADTIEHTQAQTALMTNFSEQGVALRKLLGGLISECPQLRDALAERLSGLSVRYPPRASAHPLVGQRAPDLRLSEDVSLFGLLTRGDFAVVDFTGGVPAAPGPKLVWHRAALPQERQTWSGIGAALIRPDGYVGWASDESDPTTLARELERAVAATRT